ncbi:hypothetical protein DI005_12190 [Prauserella sp. PE36]|uniref:hypothetical protein n=1 Tax=Prauserella sp. PE36 TaxID=1504709 RepID=UPI000DE2BB98|nr:hypothetical protein [Prauserella sp. PE36]RBM21087.1 hypothetical protein DI005_12190 [Prauserella sp. PE36]
MNEPVADYRPRPFSPLGDRPTRDEPLLAPVFANWRGMARRTLVSHLAGAVVGIVLLVVDDGHSGLAAPMLLIATLGPLWLYNLIVWVVNLAPAKALLDEPGRYVTTPEGGLRYSTLSVALRIADAPDERWVVVWLGAGARAQLRTDPRLWLVGPGRRGLALAASPGSAVLRVARVHNRPPHRARPVAALAHGPSAPCDDAVLQAHVRSRRRTAAIFSVSWLLVLAWLTQSHLPVLLRTADLDRHAWVLAAALALAGLAGISAGAHLTDFVRVGRAGRALTWTPLPATIDGDIAPNGHLSAYAEGRVRLPDGTERLVTFASVSPDLVADVASAGRLWILGALRPGGRAMAGIPARPLAESVTLGRRTG